MLSSVMDGVLKRAYTTKRTPSNRASPLDVPTHRYPSGVCAIARILFSGSPSCVRHVRLTYLGSCDDPDFMLAPHGVAVMTVRAASSHVARRALFPGDGG